MKILFITDLYPIKIGEKTTPQTLHNFVFEWIKQGHDVDVIKPNFIFNSFLRAKPFYKTGFYKFEGVNVFNVNYFTPFMFDFIKKLPKEYDFSSYDVIIAHMPSGIIFANKLAKIIKKPLICGVHVSDIEILTNPIYSLYFKNELMDAYQNAKKIACRSHVLQKKFSELMPECAEKTFVASSGVNPISRSCQTYPNQTPSTVYHLPFPLHVLSCANLIKRKNIDKLILAMKGLDGFELKIIGDGKELNNLQKLAKKFNSNVEFLGRLPNDRVLEEMSKSDIFVLPSTNETFGMVYLEAMASGCITVCTKHDGIDGIIKDGENGFLCEATPKSIKETLLKIKNSENAENIIKNTLMTAKTYTKENCAKKYLSELDLK